MVAEYSSLAVEQARFCAGRLTIDQMLILNHSAITNQTRVKTLIRDIIFLIAHDKLELNNSKTEILAIGGRPRTFQ